MVRVAAAVLAAQVVPEDLVAVAVVQVAPAVPVEAQGEVAVALEVQEAFRLVVLRAAVGLVVAVQVLVEGHLPAHEDLPAISYACCYTATCFQAQARVCPHAHDLGHHAHVHHRHGRGPIHQVQRG